jgi:hypothetical protein
MQAGAGQPLFGGLSGASFGTRAVAILSQRKSSELSEYSMDEFEKCVEDTLEAALLAG